MRFLALALISFASLSISSAETYDVKRLIQEAESLGAPFTPKSRHKLNSNNWGALRSNRTSNVIVFNTARKTFNRKMSYCPLGSPSSGLLPEDWFHGRRSIVYGFQNTKYRQGLNCTTLYETRNGDSWFSLTVVNPFYYKNVIYFGFSPDLFVSSGMSYGNNNQVRLVVSDASRGPQLMSGEAGGSFHYQSPAEGAMSTASSSVNPLPHYN